MDAMETEEGATLAGSAPEDLTSPVWDMPRAPEPDLAWSEAELPDTPDHPRKRSWVLWALLVMLLCATSSTATWFGTVFYHDDVKPSPPIASATPQPASKPSPPAPKTTPAPPLGAGEHTYPPPPPDAGKQFLALTDSIESIEITNPDLAILGAKNACQELRTGAATPEQIIEAAVKIQGDTRAGAAQLLHDSEIIYCPEQLHKK